MPSAQTVTQNPHRGQSLPKTESRASRGLILVGIVLLILALLMFLYAKGYRPQEKKFEERIEQTLRADIPERQSHSLTFSSRSLSSQESRSSNRKPGLISAHRFLNHPQHANRQKSSGFSLSQIQSQKVTSGPLEEALLPQDSSAAQQTPIQTPEQINKQEKQGIVRRFFKWLAGLFRGKKQMSKLPNSPPVISGVTLSETTLVLEPNCAQGLMPAESCAFKGNQVQVRVNAMDADGDELRYKPFAQVGRLSGDKGNITWDLSGVSPGTHTLNVSASDGKAESGLYPVTLNIQQCDCRSPYIIKSPCPYPVSVSAPDTVVSGEVITFSSDVAYSGSSSLKYNWTVSPADTHIIRGAGTPTIMVDSTGLMAQTVTATLVVDDGSGERACRQTAQAMTVVVGLSPPDGVTKTTMRGTIVDKNGVPIQGAEVAIMGEDGKWRRTITDAKGRYEFDDLPVGFYRMMVSHRNIGRQIKTVSLWPPPPNGVISDPPPPDGGTVESLPVDIVLLPEETIAGGREPSPTPFATPSPTSSPTPSPSPTPSFLKIRKQDEIRIYYPERFLKDTEGEVRFELEQVAREVTATTTTTNANVEVRSAPAAVPGVAIGTPLAEAFAGYDAYATVRLIPTGLVITSEPVVMEQLLGDKLAKWVWRLKPGDNVGEEASFRFELSVVWRAKDKTLPDKTFPDRWPHEPFKVGIGPPPSVKAAVYGAPVSLGGGVVALGLGALQRRRKRLMGEEESEEEDSAAPVPPAEETEEEVSSTVYAPTEAPPGDSFLVQVFVHLPEQADRLDELAIEADDAARMRISNKLKKKIKRGTELAFHLTMPGLEIDEPVQSCVWNGEPVWTQFGVTVPQDRKPGNIIGTVIVSEASVPIGHLKFKFKITGGVTQEESAPASQAVAAGNMTRYKQAFISYASQDRAEVLKRVQMLNLVKVKFFQDLLTLEPGDAWERLLYKYIDESDVFYLFWSRAASESEWVKKEIVYAIKRKGGNEESTPEIVPVIIEGPPAIKPPDDLSFLHFNDKFMYFIKAEETEN